MNHPERKALVVGASGISGFNVAKHLVDLGWEVGGISRKPPAASVEGVTSILVDITDRDAVAAALGDSSFTHVFYCTWARRDTEAENREINSAMLQNTLDALAPSGAIQHAALVTGLKYYMGPFEAYGTTNPNDTPFRERHDRLEYENFYYDQEDILLAEAERQGFTWSVHRSHTLIGWALGNAMNMGVTLAVYGAICRHQGRPFVFPGTPVQYEGLNDMTDATLLAEQLVWAATTPAAANQALNIVNGDVIRWRTLWDVIAGELGVEAGAYPGERRSLEEEMRDAEPIWQEVVKAHSLRPLRLDQLVSWWHTDADLGREMETLADMNKSRRLGFLGFRDTEESFASLFARLRAERIIP